MYDRAPRNFTFQSSVGTPYEIGPGSYQHFGTINTKSDGYAPFQSLASRDFNLAHDDAQVLPGPAQYDSKLMSNKILGGSSIGNGDVRFKPIKSDIPGPGQYCVEDKIKCYSADSKKKTITDRNKIIYKREEMPPSIPNAQTAFGYEEGPQGKLIKQGPPQRDISLGPAFYVPKIKENAITDKYKGCFWSYDRARRTDFSGSKGPGPGQYDPFSDRWLDMTEYYQSRESGKFAQLRIPRFIDDLQRKAIKDHIPGPASYMHSGLIECPKPVYNEEGEKIEHPPFGVQAQRFRSQFDDIPGPGSYNDPRTALNSLKKVTGMKRSPFGLTATRFTEKVDIDIPGPQVYNVSEATKEKPSYISMTKKGGFGSTSIRDVDLGNRNANDIPGPSHYQPKQMTNAAKLYQPMSSMFASLTNRDYDPVIQGKFDLPDATQYDVISAFNKSQGKKHYTEPRTKDAKRRHCSFLSNASRYAKGSPLDCVDPSLPGPASYDHKTYLNTKTGKFYYREKRFNAVIEETPGPGQYELPEKIADTVVKPTFNSTLGVIKEATTSIVSVNPPTREHPIAIL